MANYATQAEGKLITAINVIFFTFGNVRFVAVDLYIIQMDQFSGRLRGPFWHGIKVISVFLLFPF